MEPKYNNATHNRPEGDRILDAPYVLADLEKYSEQLMDEKSWENNDRNGITVFKSEKQTIVLSAFKKGAKALGNIVKGKVTIQILKGAVSVVLGTSTAYLKGSALAVIHENYEHDIAADEESILLITTSLI